MREGEKRGFSSAAAEGATGTELTPSFVVVVVVVVVSVEFNILRTGRAAALAGDSKSCSTD